MSTRLPMNRRDFLRLSTASAAGLVAAACVPQGVAPGDAPAPAMGPDEVEVSFLYSMWWDADHNSETPWIKAWTEGTNVKINPSVSLKPEYNTKLATLILSDDLPDMAETLDKMLVDQYGPEGVFAGFEVDYIEEKMPSVKALMAQYPGMKKAMISDEDGKVYLFPYISPSARLAPWMYFTLDEDYAQTIGVNPADITTLDDYTEMFRAVKALGDEGPEGAGGFVYCPQWAFSDEPVLGSPTDSTLAVWGMIFRTSHRPFFNYDEEKYVFGPSMPEYQKMVEYLAMLTAEDMFFPEWVLMGKDKKKYVELAHSRPRKIGVSTITPSETMAHGSRGLFHPVPPPKHADGSQGYYVLGNPVQAVWKSWVVNAEAENQDRILSLIDRGYSPDGAFKSSFGQENINWFRGNPPLDKITRWSEADFPGWGDGWWGHTGSWYADYDLEKYNRPNSGLGAYLEIMKHEIMGVYMHGRQPLTGAGFHDADGNLLPLGEWTQIPEGWAEFRKPIIHSGEGNLELNWTHYDTYNVCSQAEGGLMPPPPILGFTRSEVQELQQELLPLETFIDEQTIAFITGRRSFSEWDAFQAEMEKFDIPRVMELFNISLERYKAK